MKIPHSILADAASDEPEQKPAAQRTVDVEKNRLFETLDKEEAGNRNYTKLFLVAVVVVLIAGGIVFYLMLPGVGDTVRAPKGLEDAVRAHLLDKQKRTATDIKFYYCGGNSYWARAGVETRTDIPNPVYKLDTYAVTAKGPEGNWDIASSPVASPDQAKPCS